MARFRDRRYPFDIGGPAKLFQTASPTSPLGELHEWWKRKRKRKGLDASWVDDVVIVVV